MCGPPAGENAQKRASIIFRLLSHSAHIHTETAECTAAKMGLKERVSRALVLVSTRKSAATLADALYCVHRVHGLW